MPTLTTDDHNIGNGPLNSKGRDPKATGNKSVGNMAINDAMLMVVGAWAVLFLLSYSLRHHNI